MNNGVRTPGFGDAAEYVSNTVQDWRRHLHESRSLGVGGALHEELGAVWDECRSADWDGFGAQPVDNDTLRNTYRLLESLPLGFPIPSIGSEPDGSMTLEWHRSARRTLSVSVAPDGNLHYAALLGPNRTYGTEAFFGEVPESILDLIRRVYEV